MIECCLNGRIYDENCRRQNVSRWITSRKIRAAGPLKDRSTTLGMRTRNKARSNLRFVYHQLYISCVCYFCKFGYLFGLLEARNLSNWGIKDFSLQILEILKGDGCCDIATIEILDQTNLCTIRLLKY